jgi:hypothetical protein
MRAEPLAAEFCLAAACCRLPGRERDEAVRAAAASVDWGGFERVAARHRIEGLVHAALVAAGVTPDAAAAEALRHAAGVIVREGLAMAAETARLQGLLDAAGIANLVLKGATLDILAWGRIGLKRSQDIDLLVAVERVGPARTVLEQAGYRLERPADGAPGAFETWVALAKEAVFRHPGLDCLVELHWRLADVAALLPGLSVCSKTQSVALSPSLSLRTLAHEELFAYLCVHGASHAWSRLKWLADLGALLARGGEAERERLYQRAGDLGAGRCPATALLLCDRLLGVPLPPGRTAEIRADRKAARLAGVALDALAGGGGAELTDRPLGPERVLLSHFLFADGCHFLIAEWRRQWVSLDDRMRLRLPPRLAFLYTVVRIPLWVRRRLPSTRRSRAPPEAGT